MVAVPPGTGRPVSRPTVPVSKPMNSSRPLVGPIQAGTINPGLNAMRRAAAASRANSLQQAFTPQRPGYGLPQLPVNGGRFNPAVRPNPGSRIPGYQPGMVRPPMQSGPSRVVPGIGRVYQNSWVNPAARPGEFGQLKGTNPRAGFQQLKDTGRPGEFGQLKGIVPRPIGGGAGPLGPGNQNPVGGRPRIGGIVPRPLGGRPNAGGKGAGKEGQIRARATYRKGQKGQQGPGFPKGPKGSPSKEETRKKAFKDIRSGRQGKKRRRMLAYKRGRLKGGPNTNLSISPELLRRLARQQIGQR